MDESGIEPELSEAIAPEESGVGAVRDWLMESLRDALGVQESEPVEDALPASAEAAPASEAVSEEDAIMERLGPVLRPTLQAALVDQALLTVPGVSADAERVLRQMASQLDVPALRSALDGGPGHAQLLAYAAIGYASAQAPQEAEPAGVAGSPVMGSQGRSPLNSDERAIVTAHLQAFGDTPEERKFILSELRRIR